MPVLRPSRRMSGQLAMTMGQDAAELADGMPQGTDVTGLRCGFEDQTEGLAGAELGSQPQTHRCAGGQSSHFPADCRSCGVRTKDIAALLRVLFGPPSGGTVP